MANCNNSILRELHPNLFVVANPFECFHLIVERQVPRRLRVGPWLSVAPAYVFVMVYMVLLGTAITTYTESSWLQNNDSTIHTTKEGLSAYPPFGSALWYYNALGFFWMMFICALIIVGPAGFNACATYTLTSWTVLTIRHGMAAAAPFVPTYLSSASSQTLFFKVLEFLRFPAIAMASITFFVWNFILFPVIYLFFMDSPEKKKNFARYFLSFKLVQLHFVNIFLAYGNVVMASPSRLLGRNDLMAALIIGVVYVLWYVLVLDRIGVHLYPVFSPRSAALWATWTLSWFNYVLSFHLWRPIIAGK